MKSGIKTGINKTMNNLGSKILLGVFVAGLSLSGCSLDEPTYISQKKIEVRENYFSETYAVSEIHQGVVEALANEYYRRGENGIEILVTYDPQDKNHTARKASGMAADISAEFAQHGVKDVTTSILPIQKSADSSVMISFAYLTAHGPEGCKTIGEIEDSAHENYRDYDLGCSTDIYMARQVSRPADLLGRAESQDSVGRRQSIIVEGYRAGVPRESLEGESVSGD